MKILPVRKRLSKPLASVATCASEPTEKPNTFFFKRQKSDRKISFV